jgi:hypothetical protein
MRRPHSLGLGFVAVGAVAVLAAVVGARRRPTSGADLRPSTFLTNPNGASALAEGLERLGAKVERLRRPETRGLVGQVRPLLAVLDPTLRLTGPQTSDLAELPGAGVSLFVVGPSSRSLFRCFGFDTLGLADSAAVSGSGGIDSAAGRVRLALQSTGDSVVTDASGIFDAVVTSCRVPASAGVDTLAVAAGHPVAVRLRPAGAGSTVILLADPNLVRNRTLRDTDAGPLVLGWLGGRFDRVWFDEFHHGFFGGGSLASWVLRWSRGSPWGWLVWHAGVVGLVALAAAAVRFGPPVAVLDRRRRSVTEHVQALARALRAAGGHGLAIGMLVGGVRRRLTPGGRPAPDSWRDWLDQLSRRSANPRISQLGNRLKLLDRGKPAEGEVLSAAHLVEDLWTEMRS